MEHFLDHRREVGQRADRAERRRARWAHQPPCGGENQRILDGNQRHASLVELCGQQAVRTANSSGGPRCFAVGIENLPYILLLALQAFTLADPAATGL